jgi:anti-sigma factor RsiW
MSCSPFDLRDYFLQELPDPQQQSQVEAHVKTCGACREELNRLRVTEAALRCMADEEIPQRIGFVSDKVFEPSPWRRSLAAFWNSGARLGFASAAMLSASLVCYALRPAPAPEAAVQLRIQAAVEKAVDLKTKDLVQELQNDRMRLMLATAQLEQEERHVNKFVAANYVLPSRYREEPK